MDELKRWSRHEISRMKSEMDRLFDDLCTDFDLPVMSCRMAGDLDLKEEGDVLIVRLELDNISPDDVNVSVLDRQLIIAADSVFDADGVRHRQTFRKELKLPCVIRTEDVEAHFTDGILEVRLPKCATQLGQRIEISKR